MATSGTVGGVPGFAETAAPKGPMKLYVGSLHFNIMSTTGLKYGSEFM